MRVRDEYGLTYHGGYNVDHNAEAEGD
jgi:hypothetical protein